MGGKGIWYLNIPADNLLYVLIENKTFAFQGTRKFAFLIGTRMLDLFAIRTKVDLGFKVLLPVNQNLKNPPATLIIQ